VSWAIVVAVLGLIGIAAVLQWAFARREQVIEETTAKALADHPLVTIRPGDLLPTWSKENERRHLEAVTESDIDAAQREIEKYLGHPLDPEDRADLPRRRARLVCPDEVAVIRAALTLALFVLLAGLDRVTGCFQEESSMPRLPSHMQPADERSGRFPAAVPSPPAAERRRLIGRAECILFAVCFVIGFATTLAICRACGA
jgi:hypothetical protein